MMWPLIMSGRAIVVFVSLLKGLSFKGKEATFDYQAHISEKPVNSE